MSIIKSSLINLKGHKLRVFVTLLWIIMGITSSILVSSIGNGLKKEVTDSVSRVNPNKTRIYFESSDSNMANMETFLNPFKLEDIDELSFIEGVERIGASKDDFSMGSMYYSDAYFDKKTARILPPAVHFFHIQLFCWKHRCLQLTSFGFRQLIRPGMVLFHFYSYCHRISIAVLINALLHAFR